jgi:hypothetical protein
MDATQKMMKVAYGVSGYGHITVQTAKIGYEGEWLNLTGVF